MALVPIPLPPTGGSRPSMFPADYQISGLWEPGGEGGVLQKLVSRVVDATRDTNFCN
jgi:hypothetical protein